MHIVISQRVASITVWTIHYILRLPPAPSWNYPNLNQKSPTHYFLYSSARPLLLFSASSFALLLPSLTIWSLSLAWYHWDSSLKAFCFELMLSQACQPFRKNLRDSAELLSIKDPKLVWYYVRNCFLTVSSSLFESLFFWQTNPNVWVKYSLKLILFIGSVLESLSILFNCF